MKLFRIGCAVAATLAVVTMAKADEAAEKLIDEALPQMYHTCASLTKLADGDDDVVLDVLGKITAISIYMRKIDIESYGFSDSEKAEARARFFQAVSEGCAADENSLLAGVVDNAVKVALDL